MSTATMTSKGQLTVPADVRAKLGLRPGAKVDFVTNGEGEVVLKRKTADIRALKGIFAHRGPPLTIEEMDEAIGRAVVEDFKHSVS